MKVHALKRLLEKVDGDLEIRIDDDENGFYDLDAVEIKTDLSHENNSVINLISSNSGQ